MLKRNKPLYKKYGWMDKKVTHKLNNVHQRDEYVYFHSLQKWASTQIGVTHKWTNSSSRLSEPTSENGSVK